MKKKKFNKAFTLIELLGVILIISLLFIIVVPKLTNSINRKRSDLLSINNETLLSAAKLYVSDHENLFERINGSKSCVKISDLENEKYLKTEGKKYDNSNIDSEYIQIEYNDGFNYYFTDECIYNYQENNSCQSSGCRTCYISKIYNSGIYQYESKFVEGNNTQGNISNIDGSFIGYTSQSDCEKETILKSAEQLVTDNPSSYKKRSGNKYCLSVSKLKQDGYLLLNNNSAYNSYVVTISYNSSTNKFNYTLDTSCEEQLACGDTSTVDLFSNLTPVVYDESVKMWRIVDKDDPSWYDYENRKWANAVILTNSARQNKKVGDTVTVDIKNTAYGSLDALAMFVWIPRYSYTIKEGSSIVDIKCTSSNVKDTGTATYTGSTPSNYRTMPAFTFNNKELNGIWVGKFKVSSDNNHKKRLSCSDTSCSDADTLRILPNQEILTDTKLNSTFFYASLSMTREGNIFSANSSEEDIHMEKNSEYATVLYLKNSKYGKYTNSNYSGSNTEVYVNNSKEMVGYGDFYKHITGRSGGGVSTTESFEGNYFYDDLGDSYNIPANASMQTVSNCRYAGSSCSSSYTISSGFNDVVREITFSIDSGKVGRYNADISVSGYAYETLTFDPGCTSTTLFGKTTYSYNKFVPFVMVEIYKNGELYINKGYAYYHIKTGESANFNDVLGPGNYKIKLIYSYGSTKYKDAYENTYGTRTLQSSCPSTDAVAYLRNFSVTQTTNYTNSYTQVNGIGASSTGNVYGVYDLSVVDFGENVAGREASCKDSSSDSYKTICANYINYFDFYNKGASQNTLCDGNKCYGHALKEGIFTAGVFGTSTENYGTYYQYRTLHGSSQDNSPYETNSGTYISGTSYRGYRIVLSGK